MSEAGVQGAVRCASGTKMLLYLILFVLPHCSGTYRCKCLIDSILDDFKVAP